MRRSQLTSLILAALMAIQSVLTLTAQAEGESDPLWNQPSYEKKVNNIGQRILAANGIRERIAFVYNRSHVINASARRSGGNTIVIYKDLLGLMDSDDELAAILSHEIAHITLRHNARAGVSSAGMRLLVGTALMAAAVTPAAPLVIVAARPAMRATIAPVQRTLEKEADLATLDYMVRAGYNPLAMETILNKAVSDGSKTTQFFSTHPMGTDRLTYVHTAIVNRFPQFLNDQNRSNPVPGSPYLVQNATTIPNRTVYANPNGIVAAAPATSASPAIGVKNTKLAGATPTSAGISTTATASNQPVSGLALTSDTVKPAAMLMLASSPPPEKGGNVAATRFPSASASASTSAGSASAATTASSQSSQTAGPAQAPAESTKITTSPPARVSYQTPHGASQKPPSIASTRTRNQLSGQNSAAMAPHTQALNVASNMETSSTPTVSVAQTLLELSPDALRLVRLVSQRGMMTREDLNVEFEALDDSILDSMLLDLQNNKKLLGIQGGEPNPTYTLTPRAAQVLEPH